MVLPVSWIADSTSFGPLAAEARTQGPQRLSASETHVELKQAAIEAVLTLTNYEPADTLEDIAARLLSDAEAPLTEAVGSLHHPGSRSRGAVIYPQLGGITPDRASVMVVVEQQIDSADGVRSETRTLDVRLRREAGQWRFDYLASAGGEPVPLPEFLSPEALAVLNNPRIDLADSARWDILAGRISPALLQVLARIAERTPLGVVTFYSGHPWEVFGTDRQSDHSRGLAADIYSTGGVRVIDDREVNSATYDLVTWLHTQPELARIGSPWELEDIGVISFSDALHQDHIHIAVDPNL